MALFEYLDLNAQTLLIASFTAVLLYIVRQLYIVFVDPLKDVPGPFLARFTSLWLAYNYHKGDYHLTLRALHRKHGPIVRIAPRNYSIDDANAAKVLYGLNSKLSKSSWYSVWGHPDWDNLFNILESRRHSIVRRKFAHVYSMSSLVQYEPFVDHCNTQLRLRLSEAASLSTKVDLQKWLQCYAFDVISMITFSEPLGFLQHGNDVHGFMSFLESSNYLSAVGGLTPRLHRMMMKIATKLPESFDPLAPINYHINAQIQRVRKGEKTRSESGPMDFVEKMLNVEERSSSTVTNQDVLIAATGNMTAGSDTTSISLSGILYHLYRDERVLQALRSELGAARATGLLSDPVTFKQAQALPYLQAVIKEGMRLHPAVGFTLPRVVEDGGLHIAGRVFPAGSIVGINPWVAHINKDVFGADAETYRPERWLENQPGQEAYFLTFGQGQRTCIGKNISMLEISKLVPTVVEQFDMNLGDSVGQYLESTNHWFVKPKAFEVVLRERQRY